MGHELGMIHGRFQPFHLEHLRYMRLAWERCERILVGITNPDPGWITEDKLSRHRHLPESNPFTFTERLMMIQDTLREEGYPMERIHIVPFPIHHPERWRSYVPPGTVMYVVAYSPWERQKAEKLRNAGYRVEVIDTLSKGISGEQIRKIISSGGDWEHLVPGAVARFIHGKLRESR
ncbi:MAG: nicotinate-nucleotide adenylyltransferase [Deltaproteobacteria bacterium]|nr:nicotinate-nucleotide adenylyltransferase [Deltaproteobacteria bacterium]